MISAFVIYILTQKFSLSRVVLWYKQITFKILNIQASGIPTPSYSDFPLLINFDSKMLNSLISK